jgi:hypothetical protein
MTAGNILATDFSCLGIVCHVSGGAETAGIVQLKNNISEF